jgi:hypothetical protein
VSQRTTAPPSTRGAGDVIIFLRFMFSLPGLLTVATIFIVTRYPEGSAQIVATTIQGFGAFLSALADLLGIDTNAQPTT